ncbi:MAG: hypothetical protein ACTSR8_12475 [Promethearchaeota archaeon]
MNKYGFLSAILTFILLFFHFIPIGIYFKPGGDISLWLLQFFGINENSFFNYYESIPVDLFHYRNKQVYISGILSGDSFTLWHQIHLFTFFLLFILTVISGIITLIGCTKENKNGAKLMSFNLYALLLIILYILIGIPIYSRVLIDVQFKYLDIFYYLSFGFYILIIDFILALEAKKNHPINE